jgi:hypothetical protein
MAKISKLSTHNYEENCDPILQKLLATLMVILVTMVIWCQGFVEPCCNKIIQVMLVSLYKGLHKSSYLTVV